MENFQIIVNILFTIVVSLLFVGIWMRVANKIGKVLGISKFIMWIASKLKTFIS
ncbi:hypothetical protein HLPR_01700 [Helicovermis profundi]|uniref:ATP synthase F0 subunit 8 n=1 Tax=Helicovermis profundi TaxID=3065157 RepID=A0AAU9EIW4_9FIRM|nr:hypothetical protein HLPR_01700 [Clostridia bacterium S502]